MLSGNKDWAFPHLRYPSAGRASPCLSKSSFPLHALRSEPITLFFGNGSPRVTYLGEPAFRAGAVLDVEVNAVAAASSFFGYLWAIRETMARMSEVNRLAWEDVSLEGRYVILYTRKKRGGHLTPRKVPMTERLFTVLSKRYSQRDKNKPWVFWHRYWSSREGAIKEGPYQDRKKIMRVLCKRAGVKYFRFHPLRHSGASIMDANHVPMGVIQKILDLRWK